MSFSLKVNNNEIKMIKNGEYCYRIALMGEINCGMSELFWKINHLDKPYYFIADHQVINLELNSGDKIKVTVRGFSISFFLSFLLAILFIFNF